MKILVQKPDQKPTRILLPTGLVFSSFSAMVAAALIRHTAKKHGTAEEDLRPLSGRNMRRLCREIRRSKKRLGTMELPLVEVENRSGKIVKITL